MRSRGKKQESFLKLEKMLVIKRQSSEAKCDYNKLIWWYQLS